MKKIFLALTFACLSSASLAENYFGFQYGSNELSLAGNDLSLGTVNLLYGAHFNNYVSAEVRLGVGMNGDSVRGVEVDAGPSYGAFLRVNPGEGMVSPYAMLGYTKAKAKATSSFAEGTGVEEGLAFAFGLKFRMAEDAGLALEFMRVSDNLIGLNLGYQLNF